MTHIISAVAYADDLTPIVNTSEEMQKALSIIHGFLEFIGDEAITKIKHGGEKSRYLGVYMTLNGLHTETIKHTQSILSKAIAQLARKSCPGQVSTKQ